MSFVSLKTYNFRNLKDLMIDINYPQVFLIGENGQGKTNFLEALYLLCFGNSFRNRNEQIYCKTGESEFSLIGDFIDFDGDRQKISYSKVSKKRTIKVNDKIVKDRKELINNIPSIVFSHDDIELVTGSPERRRLFFNQTLSLHNLAFIDLLRRYKAVLTMRNNLLKNKQVETIEAYNVQLASSGIEIIQQRAEIVAQFNQTFTKLFKNISGMNIDLRIVYQPSWKKHDSVDLIMNYLEEKNHTDMLYGTTTTGPHRDHFYFMVDRQNFSHFASTGQKRLISLVLKVAQASFFSEYTSRKPIMLFDDVLLELDKARRERFIKNLPEYNQSFYTFLPDEDYKAYIRDDSLILNVRDGDFIR